MNFLFIRDVRVNSTQCSVLKNLGSTTHWPRETKAIIVTQAVHVINITDVLLTLFGKFYFISSSRCSFSLDISPVRPSFWTFFPQTFLSLSSALFGTRRSFSGFIWVLDLLPAFHLFPLLYVSFLPKPNVHQTVLLEFKMCTQVCRFLPLYTWHLRADLNTVKIPFNT